MVLTSSRRSNGDDRPGRQGGERSDREKKDTALDCDMSQPRVTPKMLGGPRSLCPRAPQTSSHRKQSPILLEPQGALQRLPFCEEKKG